jgi:16S rRNA C967 or C1407 C5-methylase (RsmB/RsmF family)
MPQQNEVVLDMAAAPGGKTTHMAQLMKNKGVIVAIDKKIPRLIALKNNIERMGVANVIAYNENSMNAETLGMEFDKIMLDTPCSGNFAQEEGWFEKRNLEGIKSLSKVQRNLLRVAHTLLKRNGELVYATCSLEPEENEENVEWFLKTFSDMNLVSKERMWPSEINQGFFIAKFRKGK